MRRERALEDLDVLSTLKFWEGAREGQVFGEVVAADCVADIPTGEAKRRSGGVVEVGGDVLN